MATPATNTMRLNFLYPHLYRRSGIACDKIPLCARPIRSVTARIHTSARRCQLSQQEGRSRLDEFPQRVGTAVEPIRSLELAPIGGAGKRGVAGKVKATDLTSLTKARKSTASHGIGSPGKVTKGTDVADDKLSAGLSKPDKAFANLASDPSSLATPAEALATVLHMDPPLPSSSLSTPTTVISSTPSGKGLKSPNDTSTATEHKHPHLQATPYVHHFDSYTLVQDLERGSFSEAQSIIIMKAVRNLLATNLDIAREGLVSKSDVENETYLFRAASSELRTEVQNLRSATTTKMRAERAQLQHEVDILNQKMTQESMNVKDNLKGMFDDRKMAVRMDQREMESKIQELNYKITVSLNSDAKSDVEGLRWVLTQRAALAVGIMAFLILGSLRYTTYQMHLQELAQKRKKDTQTYSESGTQTSGSGAEIEVLGSLGGASTTGSVGADPNYVSLG